MNTVSRRAWGASNTDRVEQFKLIYDYIKFHIGLYLATPPVFSIVAESFGVKDKFWFQIGLGIMIVVYLVSGIHAGLFMGKYINEPWTDDFLDRAQDDLFSNFRRNMHHTLYWIGLLFGLVGLICSILAKYWSGS